MEPNPADYGTNFLTHMKSAIEFVKACDHSKIKLNFDLGALKMNDEFDLISDFSANAEQYISHVHISNPFLKPVDQDSRVEDILRAFENLDYDQYFSIEMRQSEAEPLTHVKAAAETLAKASHSIFGRSR